VRFNAPSGAHDDAVMALAFALHGAVVHAAPEPELAGGFLDAGDWSSGYNDDRADGYWEPYHRIRG